MADQTQFFVVIPPTFHGLGSFEPDMLAVSGTLDGINWQGNSDFVGLLTYGLILGTQEGCFLNFAASAIFSEVWQQPQVSGLGSFDPDMLDIPGAFNFDAVPWQGNTSTIAEYSYAVVFQTSNSCFYTPAAPPPYVIPPNFTVGGAYKSWQCKGNIWDLCILQELARYKRVDYTLRACRPIRCYRTDWEPVHEIPAEGREFRQAGSMAVPLPGSGDILAASIRVPTGYMGILYGALLTFDGLGWIPGDGQITWRFKQQNRWIKGMAEITTPMGDFTGPMQFDEYVLLHTQQTVEVYVNIADTAILGGGNIHAAMYGWYFPLQYHGQFTGVYDLTKGEIRL